MLFHNVIDNGEAVELFVRRIDAKQCLDDVRGDDPELSGTLRLERDNLERLDRQVARPGRLVAKNRRELPLSLLAREERAERAGIEVDERVEVRHGPM